MKRILVCMMAFVLLLTGAACTSSADPSSSTAAPASSTAPASSAAPSSAAGSDAPAGDVTIRMSWWGGDSRHDAVLKTIAAYEEANPGVTFEPEYSAFAQYRDKFNIQLTSGAAPDVMAVDQPWVASIVSQGDFFLDIASLGIVDVASFDSYLIDTYCVHDGKTLFLPAGVNGMGSLVDAEALAQFGFDASAQSFTWDDVYELGRQINAANPNQYLACTDSKQCALYYAYTYQRQLTGKPMINDDGTMGVTKEELTQVFEHIDRLYTEKIFQPIEESGAYNNSMTQNPSWIDRNMFMILGRTSAMTDSSARLWKDDGSATTTNFLLPTLADAKNSGIEVRPSILFAVSATSAVPEESVKFLNFMFTDNTAAEFLASNFSIPAREATRTYAATVDGLLDSAALANVEYSLANAGPRLNAWSSNSEVEAMFTEIMEKIAYKQFNSMSEAADEVFDRVATIVSTAS